MAAPAKANRGPSAAAENRAALIASAREVFSTHGVDAPLSRIAKDAGVGQGSLYRHFPERIDLVVAVFDANIEAVERLASRPGIGLEDVTAMLLEQSAGFATLIPETAGAADDERLVAISERVRGVVEGLWEDARRREIVAPATTVEDYLLAVGMVASYLAHAPDEQRRDLAARAWALVRRGLAER